MGFFSSLQSMSATSGGSSSYVRFSDNEISKILSIPVSMLSESSQEAVSCTETQAKTNVSSATAVCDNASRNLLHLNKVRFYLDTIEYNQIHFLPLGHSCGSVYCTTK